MKLSERQYQRLVEIVAEAYLRQKKEQEANSSAEFSIQQEMDTTARNVNQLEKTIKECKFMEFKDILKSLRIEKGMTQQELGEKVGLGREAIYKYEKGIVINPKRSIIEKLATIFDVSPTYLLGISDKRTVFKNDFTQEEEDLIGMFRKLNAVGRERLQEDLEYLLTKEKYTESR